MQSNDENHKNENQKPSTSSKKKDMFTSALKGESSESGIMSNFVNKVREEKGNATDTRPTQSEPETPSDSFIKKELSSADLKSRLTSVEKSELNKVDPSNLQPSDFEYNDSSNKRRILAIVLLVAVVGVAYYFVTSPSTSQILLSNKPISSSELGALSASSNSFQLGQPVYVHFNHGSDLAISEITIKISVITDAAKPGQKERVVGQSRQSIKPTWQSFSTYFQPDYFVESGSYKIAILKPSGTLIASQNFKIK